MANGEWSHYKFTICFANSVYNFLANLAWINFAISLLCEGSKLHPGIYNISLWVPGLVCSNNGQHITDSITLFLKYRMELEPIRALYIACSDSLDESESVGLNSDSWNFVSSLIVIKQGRNSKGDANSNLWSW